MGCCRGLVCEAVTVGDGVDLILDRVPVLEGVLKTCGHCGFQEVTGESPHVGTGGMCGSMFRGSVG